MLEVLKDVACFMRSRRSDFSVAEKRRLYQIALDADRHGVDVYSYILYEVEKEIEEQERVQREMAEAFGV